MLPQGVTFVSIECLFTLNSYTCIHIVSITFRKPTDCLSCISKCIEKGCMGKGYMGMGCMGRGVQEGVYGEGMYRKGVYGEGVYEEGVEKGCMGMGWKWDVRKWGREGTSTQE